MMQRFAQVVVAALAATDRLLGREVLGADMSSLLSDTQRSAWFLPGVLTCADWRAGC